jgi:Mrp family chromosome partitioning ATPase
MSIAAPGRPGIPQRSQEVLDPIVLLARARLPVLALALGLAAGYAATLAWPVRYAATARVMLPASASDRSRIVQIEHASGDPHAAASAVGERLEPYLREKALLLDSPTVLPRRPSLALNLALGGGAGLVLGLAGLAVRQRSRRPVRCERELVQALGEPLLAARPLRPQGLRELCAQLLEHWFAHERRLLAIVSPRPGDGRSSLAAQLALAFAALGERTLLIDGDFRAPAVHRAFNLPNARGLADLLQDRHVSLACAGPNLSVMVAGAARADPLELLARARLPVFLAEARKHFRVVLIDTPPAARGPDFQMFAALAGGVLVLVGRDSADDRALRGLHAALERCAARLVVTVTRER